MKRLALLPFLFLCATLAAQTEDDMAQLVTYAARINYFNRLCPQEKVYLHLDNTAYFQGETIWYAANVVDATTGGEAKSKVLYVELLSPTGVVLRQQKLKVVDGRCHGSFPLVDGDVKAAVNLRGAISYPSGYYQIRAYTRAMLNFDEASIFSRVIPVYKEPEQEGFYDDPIIAEYEGLERSRPKLPRSERPKSLNVSFFPEGGHLIEGVSCRIAFKVTDEHGMGVEVDSIIADNGKGISKSPTHKGMGYFVGKLEGDSRRISFMKDGKRYTFSLPRPEKKGCAVRLNALRDDSIRIAIKGRNISSNSQLGYTILCREKVVSCDDVRLTPDAFDASFSQALICVPKAGLPTGIHQFTLFDSTGAILAQRLFFVDNGLPVVPVTAEFEKADFQPFDEMKLNLKAGKPATFSLAVRDAADYGTAYRDDIRTYMLLSSELKGLIEEPGWYFDASPQPQSSLYPPQSPRYRGAETPEGKGAASGGNQFTPPSGGEGEATPLGGRLAALDVLMMVQGWTRYDWQQMVGVTPFVPRHYTEEQLVLDGWAFSRILEVPLSNVKMTAKLYSPDRKLVQRKTVTTDSLGYWSIGLDDYEGEWDLFLFSKRSKKITEKMTTRVRFERSYQPHVSPFRPEDIFLPDYESIYPDIYEEEKGKTSVHLPKVQFFPDYFNKDSFSYLIEEVVIEGQRRYIDYNRFRAFDANKDTEMDLDEGNYTNFVRGYLEEKGYALFYEYDDFGNISSIKIDNHPTSWTPIYHSEKPKRFRSDPIVAPWDIDMEDVQSVLVFNYEPGHRYVKVEIHMKDALQKKQHNKNYRHTTFTGYTPVVEFYAPTYPNGPIPGDKDYRRTIYWNPEVTTDADGCATVSFYNNGYSRALTISAEGLTPDGVPIINK